MSTPPKEEGPGLLSKVAKFVRNPMTNWADLDKPAPDSESGYSKQALKEMIERKRRNDFVRKREFDQLRKLRNRAPDAPPDPADSAGRPSFYQSSLSSNMDERAHTLKKIDEIEAQMSRQWWKGKQVEGGQPAQNFPVSGEAAKATDGEFEETKPSAAEAQVGFEKTQMADGLGAADGGKAHGGRDSQPETRSPLDAPSGFSTSKLFAVELSDEATDPELEEASIRFANGDDDGAEAGLREALERNGQSEYAGIWIAALFDFYRATGQQAKFDSLALDAAANHGRSPPPWLAMREVAQSTQRGDVARTAPQGLTKQPLWESPAVIDLQSVGDLHLAVANAVPPWLVSWSGLKEIQSEAVKMLSGLFAQWCAQPVQLQFEGAANLEKVLRSYTISGNKTVNNSWWRMRMDALRIMRRQDEFELAALDYCVTFEVSPPAWSDPQCAYFEDGVGAPTLAESVHLLDESPASLEGPSHTVPMSLDGMPGTVVALTGEIQGDAAEVLQRLEASRNQGQGRLVVSCAQLIRVDFSAAGSILNWVASRQEEGLQVQFRDVHRLVGAFFNVIGINEHAKVVLRAN